MIPKYKETFKDICHYILNRMKAGATNDELINELVERYKFEMFVGLPNDKLRNYIEIFVEYTRISKEVCKTYKE
jgi:hypothetical protein